MITNWDVFCDNNDISDRYRKAHVINIAKCKYLDDEIKSQCKKWIHEPFSIILSGMPGRGKTYFSYAICRWIIDQYGLGRVLWIKSKNLDDEIVECSSNYGSAKYIIKKFCEIEILFLDDFGIDRGTERSERDFYQIIDKRWEKQSITIISTNLDPKGIEKAYGARIFSRFKDFTWISFEGPDMRGLDV